MSAVQRPVSRGLNVSRTHRNRGEQTPNRPKTLEDQEMVQDIGQAQDALARFAADLRSLRRAAGQPSYRELQKITGYGRTVLSLALNGRELPTWPVTEALVRGLGADPESWRPRWAALPNAADDGDATNARHDVLKPAPERVARRRARWPRLLIVIAVAVTLTSATAWLLHRLLNEPSAAASAATDQPLTAPAAGVAGGQCMRVTARDVRVFTDEHGDEPWTRWERDTKFWADLDAGATKRYRVTLRNGRHGWVTSDDRYVARSSGCP
jgi:hypothetical protein